ncbi:MAG: polysaccharide pyruvyl transferase family protein [Magnetococcales bacterium]|nr:polysaccharide pyruvyl transferase family protein [Magnetococcales bacterium]
MQKSSRVLLVTNSHCENIGDQLIAEEIYRELAGQPGWEVSRLPFLFYKRHSGNRLWQLLTGPFVITRALLRSDRLIIAGGNLLISGDSKFNISLLLYVFLATLLRRPRFLLFVGASNRSHWLGNLIYSITLKLCQEVWVRDQYSQAVLAKLFGCSKAQVVGDAAFLSPFRCTHSAEPGLKRVGLIPLGVASLRFNEKVVTLDDAAYKVYWVRMVEELLKQGKTVTLITTEQLDLPIAQDLAQTFDLPLISPKDPEELLQVICQNCDLVISTRMHGIISGMLCGKPVVGVRWQYKVDALSQEFDGQIPILAITTDGLDELPQALDRASSWPVGEESWRQTLHQKLHTVIQRALGSL